MPYRKVSTCQEEFINIIFRVAETLNLRDINFIPEYDEIIDTFLGGIYKVRISGFRDNVKIKQSFVIKWHPVQKKHETMRESYRREIHFYEKVIPALLETQRTFSIIEGLKIKFPNCILSNITCNEESLAISSLDPYLFLNRFCKVDFDHASLVMKNLAKIHGLSLALQKNNPKSFEDVRQLYKTDVQYSDPTYLSKTVKSYYSESVKTVLDTEAKRKLELLEPYIPTVLHKCVTASHHRVLCHGDCWTNNIMFKYQGFRPVDVIFIDYQFSRYASPVTDLSYFFYMSTEQDFLSAHYERLLNIYYGTLSAVLKYCNLDVNDVYPKDVLESDLKKYSVLGLIEALLSMKIITATTEEALKMTVEMYRQTEGEISENSSQNYSQYADRVNGVVNDFFARGYSLDSVL